MFCRAFWHAKHAQRAHHPLICNAVALTLIHPLLNTPPVCRYLDPNLPNPCLGSDLNVKLNRTAAGYVRYPNRCSYTSAGSVCCRSDCNAAPEAVDCIYVPVVAYSITIAGWVLFAVGLAVSLLFSCRGAQTFCRPEAAAAA